MFAGGDPMPKRAKVVIVLMLAGAYCSAGCASSAAPAQEPMQATTTSAGGRVLVVPVELDDYVIRMPATLPPGDVNFTVKNVGHHAHRLKVRGPGVDADMDDNLAPGDAGTLAVHLDAGSYRVTCPVGPHTMLGMKRTLTVKQ
jgi:uncharacterized cupredoxin-like copper-binding protein